MPRTNRNVTLHQLQAALVASGGSRAIAAKDLGVSMAWVFWLIREFENQGATFTKSPKKRPSGRPANVYVPTRAEIKAACEEIQKGWTNRERIMRRVNKVERLTVPFIVLEGESRDEIW